MKCSHSMAFGIEDIVEIFLPNEIWKEVIKLSRISLVAIACVNKQLKTLTLAYAKTYRPTGCFGKVQWLSFDGDPGDEPFLPLKMIQNFDPDHQMLTLIPEKINNEDLTLSSIDCFVSKIAKKNTSYYSRSMILFPDSRASKTKNHWVLLSKNILPGAQGNYFDVNKQFVLSKGFEIPKLIDTVVSVLMHNLKTGEFVYPKAAKGKPSMFTCVQEKTNSYQILVGDFSSYGLGLSLGLYSEDFRYHANNPASFSIASAMTSK